MNWFKSKKSMMTIQMPSRSDRKYLELDQLESREMLAAFTFYGVETPEAGSYADWSNKAVWREDGMGITRAPTTGDDVTFNGFGGQNVRLDDANIILKSLTITDGFARTIGLMRMAIRSAR